MSYHHDFYYNEPSVDLDGILSSGILAVVLVIYLLMIAFMVVYYVFQARGLQVIAKRRGIRHAWLAWLPLGNMWITGSISDQYQYVVKGRVRNRRKVLLGLCIAMYALMIPVYAAYFGMLFEMIGGSGDSGYAAVAYGAVILLFALAMAAVAIVAAVFQYIALYDLFVSCDPNNSVMYLVLGIFFSVTLPFFIFACRKKDLGMPPRKPVPPAQPVLNRPAAPNPPAWQPPAWRPAGQTPTEEPAPEEEAAPAQAEEAPAEEPREE